MKVLRAKFIRKCLRFYKIVFGIAPPYHIILDGNFIFNMLKYKLDVMHRLKSLLQEETIHVYILQSAIDELRLLGEKGEATLNWALNCCSTLDDHRFQGETPIHKAVALIQHAKSSKSPKHYFVATQDQDLRNALERIPGVPILYLNKVTLVLSNISRASLEYNSRVEDLKASLTSVEENAVAKVATSTVRSAPSIIVEEEGVAVQTRGKKKASAPNPLASQEAKDSSHNTKKKKQSLYRKH